jgi:antitoxin StbD
MTRLLTRNIATMTELRDPQKVLDAANGEPVAILKNSKLVAYLVPAERVEGEAADRRITKDDLQAYLRESRERVQPVLDYLRDK